MTAKEILTQGPDSISGIPERNVAADMPVVELLPRLLDAPDHRLGVTDSGDLIGVVDSESLLRGLNVFIAPRDDSSVVTIVCDPADYSASRIARAVEDSDAHLVDLWSAPAPDGRLRVTLRVRATDPSAAAGSLGRYGFEVVHTYGSTNRTTETAMERLLELRTLLNV